MGSVVRSTLYQDSLHQTLSCTHGDAAAQMLVMVTPGGFNRFFEDLSSLNRGLPVPDLARTEQLMKNYGMELLGPPLS
jgi:hypothetical protein